MDFLILAKDIGGQAAWSGDIENYTGYQFISGPELALKFEEHINKFGVDVRKEEVIEVKKKGENIEVTSINGMYKAKTVIIASGKRTKELGVPGEKEFKNKGLTYCATCDGPLFREKDVAVIGGGNSALDAVLQLMKIAKHTHLINLTEQLAGDPIMREKVIKSDNVTVYNNATVAEIIGDEFVNGIKIVRNNEEEILHVQGIFVEIGLMPNTDIAKDVAKNKSNEIVINCRNETNVSGIFAAGDVTDVPEKQIIIAAGEGSKALLSAFRYISRSK